MAHPASAPVKQRSKDQKKPATSAKPPKDLSRGATKSAGAELALSIDLTSAAVRTLTVLRKMVYVLALEPSTPSGQSSINTLPIDDLAMIGDAIRKLASKRKAIVMVVPMNTFAARDMLKLSRCVSDSGGTLREIAENQTPAKFAREFEKDFERAIGVT